MLNLTYLEAKAKSDALWNASSASSKVMGAFPKGAMGLTLDATRATPEWKAAKQIADRDFAALRDFNVMFTQQFKKERAAAQAARFAQVKS